MQEAGELYDHYQTVLQQIAHWCEFNTIMADQILQDKLALRIQNSKVRERLLHEKNLSLQKTDEICWAHETIEKMKVLGGASAGDTDPGDVNAFSKSRNKGKRDVVDSPEALIPKWKRVFIAGICMMCQSVKTVQHVEKRATNVTSNTTLQPCSGSVPKPSQQDNRVHHL